MEDMRIKAVIHSEDEVTGKIDMGLLVGPKGEKGEKGERGPKGKDAILPDNIVIDPDYVHTDNNFTDEYINEINSKQDILTKTDKDNLVKDSLVNNSNTLSDEEKLSIETWLGLDENYLTTYNDRPYQVNGDYNPAHKKYVDENIKELDDKVKELELFKFPNMTIVGTPTIQNGQVSNFTLDDYLEFPFLVDFRGRPFEINFAFTTGNNVTIQQNILDSSFGLALAIKNGKTLMAISYNGTTWSNQFTGNINIEPNTTYVYKISWNGMLYKVQYYNGSEYVNDFYFTSTQQPYPKQMFIGVSKLSNNYFEGSINLNYANLIVDGNVVWTGMDDVGISSRLATDLSNIDDAGVQRIKDISGYGVEEVLIQPEQPSTNDWKIWIDTDNEDDNVKYNDNGEVKEIKTKIGDSLPIGSVVEIADGTIPDGWSRVTQNLQFEPQFADLIGDSQTGRTHVDDNLYTCYIWINTHIHNREIAMITWFSGVGTYHVDRIITGASNSNFYVDGTDIVVEGANGCRGQLYRVVQEIRR